MTEYKTELTDYEKALACFVLLLQEPTFVEQLKYRVLMNEDCYIVLSVAPYATSVEFISKRKRAFKVYDKDRKSVYKALYEWRDKHLNVLEYDQNDDNRLD